jgi:hypothetical protein
VSHIIKPDSLNNFKHEIVLSQETTCQGKIINKQLIFMFQPLAENHGYYIVKDKFGLEIHCSDYLVLAIKTYNSLL